jgi:hypothetical protein
MIPRILVAKNAVFGLEIQYCFYKLQLIMDVMFKNGITDIWMAHTGDLYHVVSLTFLVVALNSIL